MEPDNTKPLERRTAIRISFQTPLFYKVCKEETITKIMEGYAKDISDGGIKCTISEEVPVGCTLWLKLDTDALTLCAELEKRVVILQHGILGKIVWADKTENNKYDIGLQFIVREAKIS